MSKKEDDNVFELEPNQAGLLCYVLGWITGLIFLLMVEEDNKFVRFHALQSIIFTGALTLMSVVISMIQAVTPFVVTGILGTVSMLMWLIGFAFWVVVMFKAYQDETFKLPLFGKLAVKYTGKKI